MVIAFTKTSLPYGWLGNMSRHSVCSRRLGLFPTAEHLFQATRFPKKSEIIEEIRNELNPMRAKWLAKKHKEKFSITPMSNLDVDNMQFVLELKIEQHPDLKEQLLATGEEQIVEDCSKRKHGSGLFWGAVKVLGMGENGLHPIIGWEGKNVLGNLWMQIREDLRKKQ